LLDALQALGFSPVVAHLNHQLRPEAEEEAEKVRKFAEGYGLPHVEGREDVQGFSRREGLSIEEAGRNLRYRFLFEQAELRNASGVLVAHTADDQVETVLMHLLRGAGLSGLKGMQFRTLPNAWSGEIPLIRPLLGVWRTEVLAYCLERGLEPVFDVSNLDSTYYRNRLRHELIPYLEQFNPGVKESFWRMAKVLQGDYEVIERQVEAAWEAILVQAAPGSVALSPEALLKEPVGIQRHLIRRAIARLRPGLRDIGFEAIEKVLDFLNTARSPAQADLVAGLRLVLEKDPDDRAGEGKDRLWIAAWEAELPAGDWPQVRETGLSLPVPGRLKLPGGWELEARDVPPSEDLQERARENPDPYQAWVSLDSSPGPFEVRARQPGDRFQPLGFSDRSLKISDFMINQKLPRRARRHWPLVAEGDQILWVPGYQIGHPYRLTPGTRRAVSLSLKRTGRDGDLD
jgi:tRNA(Ile)-lysidine synthase